MHEYRLWPSRRPRPQARGPYSMTTKSKSKGPAAPVVPAAPAVFDTADVARRTDESELKVYGRMPFVPVRGEGCYLWDTRGVRYLDLYGGHAVALTGHCHPH